MFSDNDAVIEVVNESSHNFPAENSRFHGHCGTCGGNGTIRVVDRGDDEDPSLWEDPDEVTCFACGGTGRASDEAVCEVCHGTDGPWDCKACGGTGLRVESPYDLPENYWWSDPWTTKG